MTTPEPPKKNKLLDAIVIGSLGIGAVAWLLWPVSVIPISESYGATGRFALDVTVEPMSEADRALAAMSHGTTELFTLSVRDASGTRTVYVDPARTPPPATGARVHLVGRNIAESGSGGVQRFLADEVVLLP